MGCELGCELMLSLGSGLSVGGTVEGLAVEGLLVGSPSFRGGRLSSLPQLLSQGIVTLKDMVRPVACLPDKPHMFGTMSVCPDVKLSSCKYSSTSATPFTQDAVYVISLLPHIAFNFFLQALLFGGALKLVAIQSTLLSDKVCSTLKVTTSPSDDSISTGSSSNVSFPTIVCTFT